MVRQKAVLLVQPPLYSWYMFRARPVTAFLAVAVFAILSAVSAFHMAPDREALERQVAAQALGVTIEEFCGTIEDGHEHRCPFCHKLPDTPHLAAPDNGQRITRVIEDWRGRHLVLGPQHIRAHASPRAPPRIA